MHRTLKAALKAQREPHRWFFNLPGVLLTLRSAPKSDHGFSSAELTFSTTLRLPGQFFESPKSVCETTYVKELNSLMPSLKAITPNATLMLKKHWRRVIMFLYAMKRVVDFTERTKDHFVLCRNMPSFLP